VDQDSDLGSILGSYFSAMGHRVQFTTRVNEAIKKLANQKFSHILVDPSLKPDNVNRIYDTLTIGSEMNRKTPLTLMTFDQNCLVPMSAVKRIHSLLLKPFTLEELAFRVHSRG
jgi:DNA-binding NtrC family response regulator